MTFSLRRKMIHGKNQQTGAEEFDKRSENLCARAARFNKAYYLRIIDSCNYLRIPRRAMMER